jgi:hypothetical protein
MYMKKGLISNATFSSFTEDEKEPVDFCMRCGCGKENVIYSQMTNDITIKFFNNATLHKKQEKGKLANTNNTIKFQCSCGNSITLYIKRSRNAKITSVLGEGCDED